MHGCPHQCSEEGVQRVPPHHLCPGPHQCQEADSEEGLQGRALGEMYKNPAADQQGCPEDVG